MRRPYLKGIATILIVLTALLAGCGKENRIEETEVQSTENAVLSYTFTPESSKVLLTRNGGSQTDISSVIHHIDNGLCYLKKAGLETVFGLKEGKVTEEEEEKYGKELREAHMNVTGELHAFENDAYRVILCSGSKLVLVNNLPALLDEIVYSTENEFSIPADTLAFLIGYKSLGCSVKDNTFYFTLIDK